MARAGRERGQFSGINKTVWDVALRDFYDRRTEVERVIDNKRVRAEIAASSAARAQRIGIAPPPPLKRPDGMSKAEWKRVKLEHIEAEAVRTQPHMPTPERLAQAANDEETVDGEIGKAGERVKKTRRFRDSQIERMFSAKRITEAQLNAARWYLEQWALSGISGRVVANYSPTGGGEARCIGSKLLGSERQYLARLK